MEPVLSYNFGEIEHSVRQEIHSTSARFNAALDELRSQIAPLQQLWTREAAAAYQVEQLEVAPGGDRAQPDPGRPGKCGPRRRGRGGGADRRAAAAWAR